MIVDFRRGRHLPSPLYIGGTAVEVVSSFRYLGVHISDDLTWSKNTSCLIRKAHHQRLYFLRRLRRAGLGSSVLTFFYRCVVESVLSSCIIVWHGSCSAAEKKALQRVVKAAHERTVGCSLPTTTTDIYTSRCRKRASCIMKDPTHTAHKLFVPLPSGRRLRSIKSRTTRLRNSFFPEAKNKDRYVAWIGTLPGPHPGARPGVGAHCRRAPGGRVFAHGTRPGSARNGNGDVARLPVGSPPPAGRSMRGRCNVVWVAVMAGGSRRPNPWTKTLAIGNMECHLPLEGKEPELSCAGG
ncbi:hypothetical protein L3Q82_015686 [Scortum barcoo]|uniref:Uncharacterized protein n=1 Tax=Scortum barcoo TaxID=214431 RepID=A0ACB8VP81_9TELE|nr:hypothetical protein L3Q82_015686 [Scortum barcoo]